MVQSIYQNEEIGGPAYDGLTFGGYALTTPLVKADYPGLRAIRLEDGTVILAEDLPDSYDIPPAGGGGGGPHTHDWADVTGEPSTFPPTSHDTDHDDRFSLLAHAHAGVYAPVEHDTTHDDRFSLLAHTHAAHADSDHDDRFALIAQGVPAGGATGEVLAKSSATNYATVWQAASAPAPQALDWLTDVATAGQASTNVLTYNGTAWVPAAVPASGHIHASLEMVKGRAQDLTGNTIQTAAAVKLTATFTIPAEWAGYDIEAVMSGRVNESGALTGNRTVTHELRMGNTSGTIIGSILQAIGVDTPDNSLPFSIVGYLTGQTTTGSRSVVYVTSVATDNNQVNWTHATLIATAYRTS